LIIVTGTKRSGTSMWMQILVEAGYDPIGKQFPATWEDNLKDANPSGFYESYFRKGINYHTNPHPETGAYLFPEASRRFVVKVFIPGLVRSDRTYIDQVVATMRPWREYESSIRRLCAMEEEQYGVSVTAATILPPHLDWWMENFALIRDIAIKKYPVSLSTYDALLDDPEKLVTETLRWLGGGDTAAALAAVKPDHRTQRDVQSDSFEEQVAGLCDELYDMVHRRKPLDMAFVGRLNECNELLEPRILQEEDGRRQRSDLVRKFQEERGRSSAGDP
jgi:hypothetical protein